MKTITVPKEIEKDLLMHAEHYMEVTFDVICQKCADGNSGILLQCIQYVAWATICKELMDAQI